MVYIPPALHQSNHWYNLWQWTFARGYIRIPLIVGGIYAWNVKIVHPTVDDLFNKWNVSHSQKNLWEQVEIRTQLRKEGKWKTAEDEE